MGVILLLVVYISVIYARSIEYEYTSVNWKRQVSDQIIVNEFVYFDHNNKDVLMSSSDSCLSDASTPDIYPSISYHDYSAKRPDNKGFDTSTTGLVAIKILNKNVCAVTESVGNFKEAYDTVKERINKTLKLDDAKSGYNFSEKITDLKSYSPEIDQFCSGTIGAYWLVKVTSFDKLWPRILCIFYPFPIIFPYWLFPIL